MLTGGIYKTSIPNNSINDNIQQKIYDKNVKPEFNDNIQQKIYDKNVKPEFNEILYSTQSVENELDDDEILSLVESELEEFYFGNNEIDTNYIKDIISNKTLQLLKTKLQLGVSFKIIENTMIIADMQINDNVDFQECFLDLTSVGKMTYNDCVTIYGSEISNMLLLFPNAVAYLALALKLFGVKNEKYTELDLCTTHIDEIGSTSTAMKKLKGGTSIIKMDLTRIFLIMIIFVVVVLIIVLVIMFLINPLVQIIKKEK